MASLERSATVETTVSAHSSRSSLRKKLTRSGTADSTVVRMMDNLKQRKTAAYRVAVRNSEEERKKWSKLRSRCASVLEHVLYELALAGIVLYNIVIFILEVDARATCVGPRPETCISVWHKGSNDVLLAIYSMDTFARVFTERSNYTQDIWNVIDALTLVFGYAEIVVSAVIAAAAASSNYLGYARILRLGRLLRTVKLLKSFKTLNRLVTGFAQTTKAMSYGSILIMGLLLLWSIVTVEMMEPLRDKSGENDCDELFSTVARTVLHLFQILVAGDSWGNCTVSIIINHPYMFFPFAAQVITIQLGFMNLILAVIVDASAEQRQLDTLHELEANKDHVEDQIVELYELVVQVDTDRSGAVSREELETAFDTIPEISVRLARLGLDKADLANIYELMKSEEQTDKVSYAKFIDTFMKAETRDSGIAMMMLKLQTQGLDRKVDSAFARLHSDTQRLDKKLTHLMEELHVYMGVGHGDQERSIDDHPCKQPPMLPNKHEDSQMQGDLSDSFGQDAKVSELARDEEILLPGSLEALA